MLPPCTQKCVNEIDYINGRNRAFHATALNSGVEKWDYVSTLSPAIVGKVLVAKIALLLLLWPRFTFDINQCENESSYQDSGLTCQINS